MSSGTPFSPSGQLDVIDAVSDKMLKRPGTDSKANDQLRGAMSRMKRLGLNERQRTLNAYYAWYRRQNYASCETDWDGRPVEDDLTRDALASGSIASKPDVPPGFYDANSQTQPIKNRKPCAPSGLVRTVVDEFTGLLFGEEQHPTVYIDGNDNDTDYLHALCEEQRMWALCDMARTNGGSMGTAIAGFQFLDGKPVVEIHDPRWCFPEFRDPLQHTLKRLEKRFIFPKIFKTEETGEEVELWFWYRRVIDEEKDTLYMCMPVGEGDEPDWDDPANLDKEVVHNLGFCPVVWCQNLPVQDSADGDPDCYGSYDTVRAIDLLRTRAFRGNLYNSDPTLFIQTPDEYSSVEKGNGAAINVTQGDAHYIEHNGSGPKMCMQQAIELREQFLEDTKCVVDNPDKPGDAETATAVRRKYARMFKQAGRLREQYGQKLVIALLDLEIKAILKLGTKKLDPNSGNLTRSVLKLPPRIVKTNGGGTKVEERVFKDGGKLQIKWPPFVTPTLDEVAKAVNGASNAKLAGLIDSEHATRFVADIFHITDTKALLKRIDEEKAQIEQQAQASMQERIRMPTGSR